ncbi:MAG: carboxypeptidase regulatory-like domain-containing protein, partial [Candidatus Thermoplasmatota archaeon]
MEAENMFGSTRNLWLLIATVGIVALFLGASATTMLPSVLNEKKEKNEEKKEVIVSGTGTIKYIDLEGGFWGIISDDNNSYDPTNLPEEFQVDGLRVYFEAKILEDQAGIDQWGTIVEIIKIEALDDTPQETGIAGIVIDADTGMGLYAIVVVLDPSGNIVAELETSESGYFKTEVRSGGYVLVASAEGYHDGKEKVVVKEGWVKVKIALKPMDDVVPVKNSILTGHIYNIRTGEEIEGAKVVLIPVFEAYENSEIPYKMSLILVYETTTDSSGQYKLEVPSGKYILKAEAKGFEPFETEVGIPPNKVINVDISLEPMPEPIAWVKGYVFDAKTGEPIAGAHVSLFPEVWILEEKCKEGGRCIKPWPWYGTITDENGFFEIGIRDDDENLYMLRVFARGYKEHEQEIKIAPGDVIKLKIELEPINNEPVAWVFGVVKDAKTGVGIAKAKVHVIALILWAMEKNETPFMPPYPDVPEYITYTNEFGEYKIGLEMAVRYSMDVSMEGYNTFVTEFEVEEGEKKEINVELKPIINETVILKGKVIDALTGEGIAKA